MADTKLPYQDRPTSYHMSPEDVKSILEGFNVKIPLEMVAGISIVGTRNLKAGQLVAMSKDGQLVNWEVF